MRIKICGITSPEDAELAAASGADAVGLVFVESSKRRVSPAAAAEIAASLTGRVVQVGLFVNASRDAVEQVLNRVKLDLLQFHGDEPAAFCGVFGLPYMKAHRVRPGFDLAAVEAAHPAACCHLLDAWVSGQAGGTGQTFDWTLWPHGSTVPLVLAGGLTPDNVAEAIRITHPWAVDVSGGVEGSTRGRKDPDRLRRFMAAARQAEAALDNDVSGC